MDRTSDASANRALLDDESDDLDRYVARRVRTDPEFPHLVDSALLGRRARRRVDRAWCDIKRFMARLARHVTDVVRR